MLGRIVAVVLAVALVGGCGGDGDDTSATDGATTVTAETEPTAATPTESAADEPDETAPADEPTDGGGGGGISDLLVPAGDATVAVDGTELTPQSLLRCIPFSDEEGNLDLQVLGDGFILFVQVSTGSLQSHRLSMQGTAIGVDGSTGVFGNTGVSFDGSTWTDDETGEPLDGPPFEYTGDRVSGTLTIHDSRGGQDPIEVTFDSPVPGDVNDCSL